MNRKMQGTDKKKIDPKKGRGQVEIVDTDDDDDEEEEDKNDKKDKTKDKKIPSKPVKRMKSDFDFDGYLEITQSKNKTSEEVNNDITQMLDPCYPSNLNSLIMIGICYMNQKIIDYENILCENSSKLTQRPNFNFNIENNGINDKIIDSPYAYDINEVIRILEHKFSKYIFLGIYSLNEIDRDISYSDSMIFFPRDGILPHFNYLILPYNNNTQKKSNGKSIQAFIETFQYCYKINEIKKKTISDNTINYLKKYTMKYQLRWIITINSDDRYETSCPLLNSCLYIKKEENKPFYLKISNNTISEVTEEEILSTFISNSSGRSKNKDNDKKKGVWMPLYFCYEKVPLSSEDRAKHDKIVDSYWESKKGDQNTDGKTGKKSKK